MKEIWDKLKVDFEYRTGGKYKGLVRAIGAGFASRLSEFLSKLSWIEKQAFVETADKDYLYLHAGHLVKPYPSKVASGFVVFFGVEGSEIDAGLEIKDDDSVFVTISSGLIGLEQFTGVVVISDGVARMEARGDIPSCECVVNGMVKSATSSTSEFSFNADGLVDGQSVTVSVKKSNAVEVRCKESGVGGNRGLSDVLKTKTTMAGVNKEVGVVAISGGEDDESVDDYRARVKEWKANPEAPFNERNIVETIKRRLPTIKYVWVKGGELVAGRVKVYLINRSYGLTAEESGEVVNVLLGIKPAQMKADFIESGLPVVKVRNVVIKDLLPSHDEMKAQVRKNIELLFDRELFESGVSTDEIESMVYRTELNGQRVASFVVLSGECLAEPNTFWKLGNVDFQ